VKSREEIGGKERTGAKKGKTGRGGGDRLKQKASEAREKKDIRKKLSESTTKRKGVEREKKRGRIKETS